MTYVVTSTCIDVKDGICQKVCPVECIYEGGRMMYIQPDECINCGICVSVCPVQAIYEDVDVPLAEQPFVAANNLSAIMRTALGRVGLDQRAGRRGLRRSHRGSDRPYQGLPDGRHRRLR